MHLALHSLLPFRLEQAVYGSFPFWNRGYGILARSAGCHPEWITAFKSACQRFGECPPGVTEAEAYFAQPLTRGAWMIVGVYPRGSDDLGRPGATVFHALFAPRWFFRLAGANPFTFTPSLIGDWNAADIDRILPPLDKLMPTPPQDVPLYDPRTQSEITQGLIAGKQVLVLSSQPVTSLTIDVWRQLPPKIRRHAPVATWAYGDANHFQMVTMPRIPRDSANDFDLIIKLDAPQGIAIHDACLA